jgi:hypothetical protein
MKKKKKTSIQISSAVPLELKEQAKYIVKKEVLAYARRCKQAKKEGRVIIQYAKFIDTNSILQDQTITTMHQLNHAITLTDSYRQITPKPVRVMSPQAKKTIKPLEEFLVFNEPEASKFVSGNWSIRGTHKTKKHVTVVIHKTSAGVHDMPYQAILKSDLAPNDQPSVIVSGKNLLGLVDLISSIINFRM